MKGYVSVLFVFGVKRNVVCIDDRFKVLILVFFENVVYIIFYICQYYLIFLKDIVVYVELIYYCEFFD